MPEEKTAGGPDSPAPIGGEVDRLRERVEALEAVVGEAIAVIAGLFKPPRFPGREAAQAAKLEEIGRRLGAGG